MTTIQRSNGVRILFDEAHSEAWTIRPAVAAAMRPAWPGDASYARAAEALTAAGYGVAAHVDGPLDDAALAGADVLVIAHPSDGRWERTTGIGSPRFDADELAAIERHVQRGGGLVVLGETEQDKYGTNVDELLGRFGVRVTNETVQAYGEAVPTWVPAERASWPTAGVDLLAGVERATFYRSATLELDGAARAILRTPADAMPAREPLAAVSTAGAGRVVVFADSDLFGDDQLGEHDHANLWLNAVAWTAAPALTRPVEAPASALAGDPAWVELRDAVDALRVLQEADGSVDPARHGPDAATALVERMRRALVALRPLAPAQAGYLEAVDADLAAWVEAGLGRPDFARALTAFRPEQRRSDAVEHLVVFPLYTQNGSRDTRFEALVVRTPWPAFVAALEAQRYDNAKFVPVELVDGTAGYDSECATLFPETFAVSGTAANTFGAIFCDRESERFRRVVGRAVELLGVGLPPDAAALVGSQALARDAFLLWDLIHDRAHSRGELPFDPFMVRQRMPYWMYGLEELRCDLTAFAEARQLERDGFGFARHVQHAILFDRLFRFPVTGSRVRNYDGLAGQLLFAFLHQEGYVRWADNRLTVDWNRVGDGVEALRDRLEELYRSGIDLDRVAYWTAAHALVAGYVRPALDSRWQDDAVRIGDASNAASWVGLVADDEFPLSIFYVQLRQKLAPELTRAAA